jgi:cardiolipin synthase
VQGVLDVPRWWIEIGFVLYAIVITAIVMLERRRPSSTLAWILALILLPVVGLVLYFLISRRRVARRLRHRERRWIRPIDATRGLASMEICPDDLPAPQRGLVHLALRTAAAPLRRCERVQLYASPAEAFAAMEEAIRAATRAICLEFYIWRDDHTGRRWIDLLCERARAGVDVRLLYDDFGALGSGHLFRRLSEAGGEVVAFAPLRLHLRLRRSQLNFRNHRKILTIDGAIGFTGGLNIGDEYLSSAPDGRRWDDLQVRVEGNAVLGLDAIFLEDWISARGEAVGYDPGDPQIARRLGLRALYTAPQRLSTGPLVQIIPSGPDLPSTHTIAAQFTAAIAVAQRICWIATPYFVPDEPLMLALVTAAWRGVDVRILVPSPTNNDARLVSWAARSYYDELLAAGCRIFEYQLGMLHAKCMTIDDHVAAVGSANMDVRSFYLNYEVTAMFYDPIVSAQLAEIFSAHLPHSVEIRPVQRSRLSLPHRLGEAAARLLSPLL